MTIFLSSDHIERLLNDAELEILFKIGDKKGTLKVKKMKGLVGGWLSKDLHEDIWSISKPKLEMNWEESKSISE